MAMNDVYDEEFNRCLAFAKVLILKVKRRKDRVICTKWIKKLCDLQTDDAVVKRNRNEFFRYMLQILHKCADDALPPPHAHCGLPQFDNQKPLNQSLNPKGFMFRWSHDRRTYVAVKPIPGKGALVYMAVSKDPTLGWDMEGRN